LLLPWQSSPVLASFLRLLRRLLTWKKPKRKAALHLNQIGRIAEGQVVELMQHPAERSSASKGLFGAKPRPLAGRLRHIVSYSYSIPGDVSNRPGHYRLESQVRLERSSPASPPA